MIYKKVVSKGWHKESRLKTEEKFKVCFVQNLTVCCSCFFFKKRKNKKHPSQTWGELIVNANAIIMHSFFPVIQGND